MTRGTGEASTEHNVDAEIQHCQVAKDYVNMLTECADKRVKYHREFLHGLT